MRICSFLPSATEVVYALGLGDDLYGVSHECDYPPDAKNKPVVVRSVLENQGFSSADIHKIVEGRFSEGKGIYEIDLDVLLKAEPDLILTQELCEQ